MSHRMMTGLRIVFLIAMIPMLLSGCSKTEANKQSQYPWIEEESYYVGSTASDGRVQFQYALCFHNKSEDYDIGLTHVVCGFQSSELNDWFGNDNSEGKNILVGFAGADKSEVIIPSGKKQVIIFTFEGNFLGGELPEDISYPEKIVWGESVYRHSYSDQQE